MTALFVLEFALHIHYSSHIINFHNCNFFIMNLTRVRKCSQSNNDKLLNKLPLNDYVSFYTNAPFPILLITNNTNCVSVEIYCFKTFSDTSENVGHLSNFVPTTFVQFPVNICIIAPSKALNTKTLRRLF